MVARDEVGEERTHVPPDRRLRNSLILRSGQARRLGVGSDVRQRINAGASSQRIGSAVHVQRDEEAGIKAARNESAVLERQIAVVVPGHRDPYPSAPHERVAKLACQLRDGPL